MTTTSRERRYVAHRLRIAKADGNKRYVFNRLADLIDPTCYVDSVEIVNNELGQVDGWEFHLTCGHSYERPWNEPPMYCPDCGARVVIE